VAAPGLRCLPRRRLTLARHGLSVGVVSLEAETLPDQRLNDRSSREGHVGVWVATEA
jgi:hypothetical protein